MKKIPTIFIRDENNRALVTREINPVCQWVFDGQGVAKRKVDGTCCLWKDGNMWKRREVKKGKTPPKGFVFADYDEVTGKTVGWLPVGDGPEDQYHREALKYLQADDGETLELIGPKINGNPELYSGHVYVQHSLISNFEVDRSFSGIFHFLETYEMEGLVFHHPDGRMGKIKRRDFGLAWPKE